MLIGTSLAASHNPFPTAVPSSGNAVQPRDAQSPGRAADLHKTASPSGKAPGGSDKAADQAAGQDLAESRVAEEQAALLRQLKARDREVRQHEAAHKAVGGQFAGAISYTFQRGPDGQAYAVGGEVPIDISPAASPAATIDKMQVVKAAAMAPAQPSAQDLQVAAAATQIQLQAQVQLAAEQQDVREKAELAEAGSAEDGPTKAAEGEASPEAGQAEKAVSAYQSVGAFIDSGRSHGAVFEARA